jgi:hypothetical protein
MGEDKPTTKLTETYIEKRAKDAPPPPMQSLLGVVPPPESPGKPESSPSPSSNGGTPE